MRAQREMGGTGLDRRRGGGADGKLLRESPCPGPAVPEAKQSGAEGPRAVRGESLPRSDSAAPR